jgi:hypothetical protein
MAEIASILKRYVFLSLKSVLLFMSFSTISLLSCRECSFVLQAALS